MIINTISPFPIWRNHAAVCIGNGESLERWQVDFVKDKARVIAINQAYALAPWADILYACDPKWWAANNGAPDFTGYKLQHIHKERLEAIHNGEEKHLEKITNKFPAHGVDCLVSDGPEGFSYDNRYIRHGGNSGYQAIHLAMHMRASPIILLGYDMGYDNKSHWFGDYAFAPHPDKARFMEWIPRFDALKHAAGVLGIKIINCTTKTRLKCFEQASIFDSKIWIK